MTDLITDAENRLDSLIAADEGNDTPPAGDDDQLPAGDEPADDDTDNQPNGDDPDDQGDGGEEEAQPGENEEEEPGEDEEPNPDAAKPQGDEAPKPLTDDELIAELEKRGLKVAKKDEEQEPKAPEFQKPDELPNNIWDQMKPVQRYIYTGLPYITITGVQGEGDDAKPVELQVKTPDQIPDDFKFASTRAEKIADDAFLEQNKRADQMYNKIQQTSQQTQEQAAREQENKQILSGVETLQNDGVIPKITAQPGTPEFDTDPGVIRANEILAYRQELIAKGENVSIVSAGKMFKADHPELYAPKPAPKGDAERAKASKRIAGGGRGTPASAKKNDGPKFPPGTSASDIADYYASQLD
jgi:hypothetical protein